MQCSGGIFLLGGGNLTRSNFDNSENCYLVEGGNKPLVGGGGDFSGGREMSKFSASGGPPIPPVGKTLLKNLILRGEIHEKPI